MGLFDKLKKTRVKDFFTERDVAAIMMILSPKLSGFPRNVSRSDISTFLNMIRDPKKPLEKEDIIELRRLAELMKKEEYYSVYSDGIKKIDEYLSANGN